MSVFFLKKYQLAGAVLLLFFLFSGQSYAEIIRDYYSEPGRNLFKEQINDTFNEYIDPFSGALQLKHTDISIPGNGGMDINIHRVYTSLQTFQMPNRSVNGFGWTMHFGRIVTPPGAENKICSQSTFNANTRDNPSVEWPDGG